MSIEERVVKCFNEAIGVEKYTDKKILIYNEIPEWDSVAHMRLITSLEIEFDCMLEMDDILDMSDFDKVVEIIRKYG